MMRNLLGGGGGGGGGRVEGRGGAGLYLRHLMQCGFFTIFYTH